MFPLGPKVQKGPLGSIDRRMFKPKGLEVSHGEMSHKWQVGARSFSQEVVLVQAEHIIISSIQLFLCALVRITLRQLQFEGLLEAVEVCLECFGHDGEPHGTRVPQRKLPQALAHFVLVVLPPREDPLQDRDDAAAHGRCRVLDRGDDVDAPRLLLPELPLLNVGQRRAEDISCNIRGTREGITRGGSARKLNTPDLAPFLVPRRDASETLSVE
jgi:hypothetical protein